MGRKEVVVNGTVRMRTFKGWGVKMDSVREVPARITAKRIVTTSGTWRFDRATGKPLGQEYSLGAYAYQALAYRLAGQEWVVVGGADHEATNG